MVIYYAHPLSLYNKPQEARDIALLESLGFTVLNPNAPEHEEGYKRLKMEYFRELVVNRCQALAFRAFPDGSIPAGIAKEVAMAQEAKYPIFELPCGILRRSLSVEQTREVLSEIGSR